MRIYFAGAEHPTWRKTLLAEGVKNVSVNFHALRPRLPKGKPYLLRERGLGDASVMVEAGGYGQSDDEIDAWAADYEAFVVDNLHSIEFAIEAPRRDHELVMEAREDFWDDLPAGKFMPIWRPAHTFPELERLCATYHRVALLQDGLEDDRAVSRLASLARQYQVRFHALGVTDVELITSLPIDSASSAAWTSPSRYGDTIVWINGQLKRYPKKYKEQSRRRHRSYFAQNGFDAQAIQDDDDNEVTRLAIWSFQQLEKGVNPSSEEASLPISEVDHTDVDPHTTDVVNSNLVPATQEETKSVSPTARPRTMLPLLRRETEVIPGMGEEPDQEVERIGVSSRPLMQCDTCHLSSICPARQPGASCAYEIPVRLRTQGDLNHFLATLMEIQGQRVLFGRFAEQLDGGFPDATVSQEIDRFVKITEKVKEIQDNRESLDIRVKAKANAGLVSRLFGERLGTQTRDNRELSRPIDAPALTEVVEAEVMGD